MLQLLAPALLLAVNPPQFPPYYEVLYHTQPADHFNAEDAATFQQRYLLNSSWWGGPGSPILLYTGAEGTGVTDIFSHSGFVLELARELRAMVCFAEMRFFGVSMPFGETGSFVHSATRLGLLTVEQAIADYAMLTVSLKQNHSAAASPVIALGGSLAGSLSFWLRSKYPSVVDMALAASAPILGYPGLTDPYGWYRVSTAAFESQAPGCVAAVRAGFAALLEASAPNLSRAFNTCTPVTGSWFAPHVASELTGRLASMAESSYPLAASPIPPTCKTVMAATGAGALAPLVTTPGRCLNLSAPFAAAVAAAPALGRGSARVGGAATAGEAWYYLACTEVIHPIAANNVTDMFPPQRWSLGGLTSDCERRFGVRPRPQWLPDSMGMAGGLAALPSVTSHVIFSNGLNDPWSSQSVTSNASETIVAINIVGGSHHSDLGAPPNPTPSADDSAPLVEARRREIALLRSWLRTAKPHSLSRGAPPRPIRLEPPHHEQAATREEPRRPPPSAPPPPPPPPFFPTVDPGFLAHAFVVLCGVLGTLFAFFGQRLWLKFLAFVAFAAAGGFAFFYIHGHAAQTGNLPTWAQALVAGAVGLGGATLALITASISLMICAAAAAGVLVAPVFRLAAHSISPYLRLGIVAGSAALGAAAAVTILCACTPVRHVDETMDDTFDDDFSQPRRRRRRWFCSRGGATSATTKRLEAVVTAVLGGYGLLYCVSHWAGGHMAPDQLLSTESLPECGGQCLALLVSSWSVMLLGATTQLFCLHARSRDARFDEQSAAMADPLVPQQPLASSRASPGAQAAAGIGEGGGRWSRRSPRRPPPEFRTEGSALAQRMRGKYCSGGPVEFERASGAAAARGGARGGASGSRNSFEPTAVVSACAPTLPPRGAGERAGSSPSWAADAEADGDEELSWASGRQGGEAGAASGQHGAREVAGTERPGARGCGGGGAAPSRVDPPQKKRGGFGRLFSKKASAEPPAATASSCAPLEAPAPSAASLEWARALEEARAGE